MKNIVKTTVITAITTMAIVANAQQYTGAGSTNSSYSQHYQQMQREQAERNRLNSQPQWRPVAPQPAPPQPRYEDPTQSWGYRTLAPIEPFLLWGTQVSKPIIACGIGGASLAATGPIGAAAGCIGGAYLQQK